MSIVTFFPTNYFSFLLFPVSRSSISVAAAAMYMASQASDEKRSWKGLNALLAIYASLLIFQD